MQDCLGEMVLAAAAIQFERARLQHWILGAWILLTLVTLLSLAPFPVPVRNVLSICGDDGGRAVLGLLGALACFQRATKGDGPFTQMWRLLGAYLAAECAADLLIVVARFGDFQPHWGVFYTWYAISACSTSLLALALLAWPVRSNLKGDRFAAVITGLTVGLATFSILWLPVFSRVLFSTTYRAPWLAVLWMLAYLTLGTIWLVQEGRSIPHVAAVPRNLLRAGLASLVACVAAYTYLRLAGLTGKLGYLEIADLGWLASHAFLGLAATHSQPVAEERQIPTDKANLPGLLAYLPVGAAVGNSLIQSWLTAGLDRVSATTLAVICLGFTLKEFVQHRDLAQMSQQLERRVAERTQELTRIQMEAHRHQRAQLVATLAAGVVHDLKNALGAVGMWIQVLKTESEEAERVECIEAIELGLTQAKRLVRDQLEAGMGTAAELVRVDLREFCVRLRPLLEATVLPCRLVMNVPEGLPRVWMDTGHLDQILLNLASNARDAMSEGGTFTVEAHEDPLEPFVQVIVRDDGCGIPAQVLDQIFDPFFTTKPKGVGTGLGLASVRALVLESGGRIHVESKSGQGTTFVIHLCQTLTEGQTPGSNGTRVLPSPS
jgi:signal transduction histidine kinase